MDNMKGSIIYHTMEKLIVIVEPTSDGIWGRIEHPAVKGATSVTRIHEFEEMLNDLISENIKELKTQNKEVPEVLTSFTGFKYQYDLESYLEDLPLEIKRLAKYSEMNRSLLARYAKGETTTENQFKRVLNGVKKAIEDMSALNLELA